MMKLHKIAIQFAFIYRLLSGKKSDTYVFRNRKNKCEHISHNTGHRSARFLKASQDKQKQALKGRKRSPRACFR